MADAAGLPPAAGASYLHNPSALADFFAVMDKDLQCPIYLCRLTNPAILPCSHSFCRLCITKGLEYKERCPVCKEPCTRRTVRENELFAKLIGVVGDFPTDLLPKEGSRRAATVSSWLEDDGGKRGVAHSDDTGDEEVHGPESPTMQLAGERLHPYPDERW